MDKKELIKLDEFLVSNKIEHFSAKELCLVRSLKVLNIPPESLFENILPSLYFLEFMRKIYGPILVISGYRNKTNNSKVGGAKHSQHMEFRAIDSRPIDKGKYKQFRNTIKAFWENNLIFNQVDYNWLQEGNVDTSTMGFGTYNSNKFIHVDFGFRRRSW